jgi:predicted  nucleic acid-binding Zn-ribbon protein
MDFEDEATTLKRIVVELEGKVASLEERMKTQEGTTQDLVRRLIKLERTSKGIRF